MSDLTVTLTPIPGLLVVNLAVHADSRGWFKENWQRAKMTALGLPDFGPVQNNMSHNEAPGVTRGLHAEPWDKLITVASGRIFGAWVDLREGPTFGACHTLEIGPETAVFVPGGVANGYQTLTADVTYSYLVNEHWSPEARASYTYLNLADEQIAIEWPVPLTEATVSAADLVHPRLDEITAAPRPRTVVLGAAGQVGRALLAALPDAVGLSRADLDITDADAVARYPWAGVGTVINAAAYTDVDGAETAEGRAHAWQVNVSAVAALVAAARRHRLTLVQVSSDYVFDGRARSHDEDELPAPLSTYGATKAAGDALVATLPDHYIVRTSWVVGEGRNFVRTMAALARRGAAPSVVDDQEGRLTFADDLAAGIVHLLRTAAPYGVYHLTNEGPTVSWYEIARRVFDLTGRDPDAVHPCSSAAFSSGRIVAARPRHSTLALTRFAALGFVPRTAEQALRAYLGDAQATVPAPPGPGR
ncbi:MAG: sugar nucleotide-binding protein [Propioniciclava sp.]